MPVTVWLRIMGGDLVETTKDYVADVNADMDGTGAGAGVADRVGAGVDWTAAGKRAGAAVGGGLGGALKMGGPMLLMGALDWIIGGAIELLGTEAGKPAADALAKLGDALLDVAAKVVAPMITLALRAIRAIVPVATVIAELVADVLPAVVAVLGLIAGVLEAAHSLGERIGRGLEGIGRDLGGAWALTHNALRRVSMAIDAAIAGVAGAIAGLLTFVLESVLGPLREHLENVSSLWDEWIGRHLPDFGELREPFGYMWNDVYYEWGTGPLGESPHEPRRVIEHPASDAQLVAAMGEYARANGGVARALWAPA